jgi:hypothetical protein
MVSSTLHVGLMFNHQSSIPHHPAVGERHFTERQQLRIAMDISSQEPIASSETKCSMKDRPSIAQSTFMSSSPRNLAGSSPAHHNKLSNNHNRHHVSQSSSLKQGVKNKAFKQKTKARNPPARPEILKAINKLLDISDRVPFSGVQNSSTKVPFTS